MGWLSELVEERGAEALDLHAQTVNPQFVKLLRTIGFDRRWARAQGAHLWDDQGNRYLDLLGGFGMFNVGRNNPRVREALVEALELERPGSVQLGVDVLPALLAEELLRRAPASVGKVLFTSSGAEAGEAGRELAREDVARFRVEPVQGNGVKLPTNGYLEGAQELRARDEAPFCIDEVQ